MKVLVTGGAGFIGSHSVEALLQQQCEVTVFDNFSNGKRSNLPRAAGGLRIVEGDIRDASALAEALAGSTHVLHLAAQVSVQRSVADPLESASINLMGFLNVLEAARTARVRRIVYASSAAVYGIPQTIPLDERAEAAPLSPYGLEKYINDQYASLFARLYGTSAVGLRYFNVYGPRQDPASPYAGVISRWASAIANDAPVRIFGDGRQTRDFVYVKDVARANCAALRSAAQGVCNIGTGSSVTLLELLQTLERVAGKSAKRQFEAAAPGDIRESAMRPERMRTLFDIESVTSLETGLSALRDENAEGSKQRSAQNAPQAIHDALRSETPVG